MRVNLIGGAPSSEMDAPFDDLDSEIWVLGLRYTNYPRFDKVFEIHDDLSFIDKEYPQRLVNLGKELIVGEKFPIKARNVTVFPFDEAEELFGSTYMTCSFAYMIAMAIMRGATEIGFYGIDLAVDNEEYFYQRPCVEAWMHFAKGRGINIIVSNKSSLGKSDYVYGRNFKGDKILTPPFTEADFIQMSKDHEARIKDFDLEITRLNRLKDTHNGASQSYLKMSQIARATEAGIKVSSIKDGITIV